MNQTDGESVYHPKFIMINFVKPIWRPWYIISLPVRSGPVCSEIYQIHFRSKSFSCSIEKYLHSTLCGSDFSPDTLDGSVAKLRCCSKKLILASHYCLYKKTLMLEYSTTNTNNENIPRPKCNAKNAHWVTYQFLPGLQHPYMKVCTSMYLFPRPTVTVIGAKNYMQQYE